MFLIFPEVSNVVSQLGRPDDGTETTGFFNIEFSVDLKPQSAMADRHDQGAPGHADRRQADAAVFPESVSPTRKTSKTTSTRRCRA